MKLKKEIMILIYNVMKLQKILLFYFLVILKYAMSPESLNHHKNNKHVYFHVCVLNQIDRPGNRNYYHFCNVRKIQLWL